MNLDGLLPVALAAAEAREPAVVLQTIVRGLAGNPGLALARIWLAGPGDQCATCPMRPECPDQTRCLHLAASAGQSAHRIGRALGAHRRRLPPHAARGGRGRSARSPRTGEGLLIADVEQDSAWIARPEWARAEGIRSFAGHPLVFRGEVLGVLAVFCRDVLDAGRLRAAARVRGPGRRRDRQRARLCRGGAAPRAARARARLPARGGSRGARRTARSSARAPHCAAPSIRSNSSRRPTRASSCSASRAPARSSSPRRSTSAALARARRWCG